MKTITVIQRNGNQHTIYISDCDYDLVSQYTWSIAKDGLTYYAKTTINSKTVSMHRLILNPKKSFVIDHKDRNGLNNQRDNIRICNTSDNSKNRIGSGTSKYLGVCYETVKKRYFRKKTNEYITYSTTVISARIKINGKNKRLGYFKTEEEAALIYNEYAIKHHGDFANINNIGGRKNG